MKIRNMMLRYYTIAVAKVYYIGFICMGELYMFVIRGEIPSCLLRLTYPSGEEGNDLVKIQVREANAKAQYIHDRRVVHLGPASLLYGFDMPEKYDNRGYRFEKYIFETFGHVQWVKPDNTPWYKRGDVIIDGEHVQCKFHEASVIDEETLQKHGL